MDPLDTELEALFGPAATPVKPAPVTSGAGVDELGVNLDELFAPEKAQPKPATGDDLDALFAPESVEGQKAIQANAPEEPGLLSAFTGGVQRDWARFKAMPSMLGSIKAELSGDMDESVRLAQESQAIEKSAPESKWSLQNINNPQEFGYWLSEKLGENSITMLSMAATGFAGGFAGHLAARGLTSAAMRRSLMMGGAYVPTYALGTALETAGTAGEQFEVTGSTQPGISIPAGAAKGALETITPFVVSRALMRPGLQFGRGIVGGVAKGAGLEGATELAQEEVDIVARTYSDPNYNYLGTPALWRRAEAAAAGAAIGGIVGGVTQQVEKRNEAGGERRDYSTDDIIRQQDAIQGKVKVQPTQEPQLEGSEGKGGAPTTSSREMINPDAKLVLPDGLTFNEHTNQMGQTNIEILDGKEKVGRVYIRSTQKGLQIGNISIDEKYQRKGIATSIEQYLSQKTGKEFEPDHMLSNAEYARWKKNAPEKVKDYVQDEGGQSWFPKMNMIDIFNDYAKNKGKITSREMIAEDPVEIKTLSPKGVNVWPPDKQNKPRIRAVSEFGDITAWVNEETKEVNIEMSGLKTDSSKGGGHGMALYKGLFDWALAKGYTVNSDTIVSEEASRVYQAFQRRGYEIEDRREEAKDDYYGRYYQNTYNPVFSVVKGPVTKLREMIVPAGTGDRVGEEILARNPDDDAYGATPLLRPMLNKWTDLVEKTESVYDFIEANTKRYAVEWPGKPEAFYPMALTDTEVEAFTAEYFNQAEKPKIVEINQDTLTPVGITADVFDLPPMSSSRIWFTPNVGKAKQHELLARYDQFYGETAVFRQSRNLGTRSFREEARAQLSTGYSELVTEGLRIIPSRGSSFLYNLSFTGRQIKGDVKKLTKSGRSKQIAFYDPSTGMLNKEFNRDGFPAGPEEMFMNTPDMLALGPVAKFFHGIPVSLDFNKMRPGTYSALPTKPDNGNWMDGQNVKFRKGLSEKQQAELVAEVDLITPFDRMVTRGDVEAFKRIMKKGLWIEPSPYDNDVVTLEPIKRSQLVPGYHTNPDMPDTGPMGVKKVEKTEAGFQQAAFRGYERKSEVVTDETGMTFDDRLYAQSLRHSIEQIVPAIDKILKSIGLDHGLQVRIQKGGAIQPRDGSVGKSPAWIWYGPGVIGFSTDLMQSNTTGTKDSKLDLYTTLMHELGHSITYYFYKKLPVEIKEMLQYAYQKALYYANTMPNNAMVRVGMAQSPDNNKLGPEYYLTFPEWLAEQFRRYSTGSEEMRSYLDSHYHDISGRLERFYREWEQAVDKHVAIDVTRPDHYFSAMMQYLRDFGDQRKSMIQKERQQVLYSINQDIYDSPQVLQLGAQVAAAISSLKQMSVPGTEVKINQKLDPKYGPSSDQAVARFVRGPNLRVIELAIGSLPSGDPFQQARVVYSHEVVHDLIASELISNEDIAILKRAMQADGFSLSPGILASIRQLVNKQVREGNLDAKNAEVEYQTIKLEEELAYYISNFANTGVANAEAVPILAKIIELLNRIADFMRGLGYRNRDDVIRAIFKGEMINRQDRFETDRNYAEGYVKAMEAIDQAKKGEMTPEKVVEVSQGLWMAKEEYEGAEGERILLYMFLEKPKGASPKGANPALKKLGDVVGHLYLIERGVKGWEVEDLASDRPALAAQMAAHVSKDLQVEPNELLKPPSTSTTQGMAIYRWAARGTPWNGVFNWYVKDKTDDRWYSPNHITRMRKYYGELFDRYGLSRGAEFHDKQKKWAELEKKIPGEALNDPRLKQMFMLPRNLNRDEVQGSILREGTRADEEQLSRSMGEPAGDPADAFTRAFDTEQTESIMEKALSQKTSPDQQAPSGTVSREMVNILNRLSGIDNSAEAKAALTGVVNEADKIGWFTKMYWGLSQLAWRNEHISGLMNYKTNSELMYRGLQSWLHRADDTARAWEKLPADQRMAVGEYLFWAAEMKYLSAKERASGVKRHPTMPEFGREYHRLKLSMEARNVISSIESDFFDFLAEVQRVSEENIRSTITTPIEQAAALAKVKFEMDQLRSKPYFPMTRFGKYTITVRDSTVTNPTRGDVKGFWAYDNPFQRDAAVKEIAVKFPGHTITAGIVPENSIEFMGLPPTLLRHIQDNVPGITPEQKVWLEEFQRQNLPDNTFRKRWLPSSQMAGHSMDAFRSYAHYFVHGSRYLARLEYGRILQQNIASVQVTVDGRNKNSTKRQMIVNWMNAHFKYVMEGGKDYAKMKSFITLYQLGYSPAAAAMNLTQVIQVMVPFLSGHFGSAKAYATLGKAIRSLRNSRGVSPKGSGYFSEAREEMIKQGRIDVGQAPELAAFSEGHNLNKLQAGTKTQKMYRNLSWAGMWMFGKIETWNREWTMLAAWELARANPTTKRLKDIDRLYGLDISELLANHPRWTREDAVAFLFAREAIDRTQFTYAPYERPAFLRDPKTNFFLLFFQYIQGMTYAFRFNGATVHMLLVFAFLYGLQGLPGSDDINEILKLIGKKFFGKDWDLHHHARVFARDITQGTYFDKTGPDLVLHGVSRYGFGLGLLPEGYGIGKFDASANGSMGKLVPGFSEVLKAYNSGKAWENITAEATQRLGGAGLAPAFALLQYLSESRGTVDSKKWEGLYPRAVKALMKAYEYTPPGGLPNLRLPGGTLKPQGGVTSRQGAKLESAQFNMRDPEDLAAIGWQALGFTPTKVNATWEYLRDQKETLNVYRAERTMLYGQFMTAIQSGDEGAIADVKAAINEYNAKVKEIDSTMQVDPRALTTAMKTRGRNMQLQEQLLPSSRREVPVARRLRDLYPNLITNEQKVK